MRAIVVATACAAIALMPAPALAQRQPPSPEQRLDRLERQIEQVQRQVFPRGRPASTAGFADEPAATQSSVATLNQRLDALERQMTDLVRQSEENGHRLQTVESGLAKARSDQEQRITAIEQRLSEAAAAVPADSAAEPAPAPTVKATGKSPSDKASAKPAATKPASGKSKTETADTSDLADASTATPADPGEEAYSAGFHQWEDGQYDQAIASLRAFVAAFPKHRRVSFANNLIGRALLDKGESRAAAEALLGNYRGDPAGARAADSLYYLGQALTKLGQPTQACKAYAELDAVYGSKVRADLRKLVDEAEAGANCK